jgi:hypothetical protein
VARGYSVQFHRSAAEAKSFDVSRFDRNLEGYSFHRLRHRNVSMIWHTGGLMQYTGPTSEDRDAVESCLRTADS